MGLELRLYLVALAALTRCRLPRWVGYRPEWPQHSLRHFAGVGLLVGAGSALVVWAAGHAWPALVSVLCGMAFSLWLTAARHEVGWSMWCDGPRSPEARRVAADSLNQAAAGAAHIAANPGAVETATALPAAAPLAPATLAQPVLGAAGAVGLLFMLALKATALHGLVVRDLAVMLALLPLAHAWSRAGMVFLVWWRRDKPGRHPGAAAVPSQQEVVGTAVSSARTATATVPPRPQRDGLMLAVSLLWCALVTAVAGLFVPPRALAVAAIAAWAVGSLMLGALRNRPSVPSGPGLDATQQCSELAVYLAVLGYLAQG